MAVVFSDLAVPPTSGLQEQSLLLLQGLAERGMEIDLFAFSRSVVAESLLPVPLARPAMELRHGWTVSGLMNRLIGLDGLEQRLGAYDLVYLEGAAAAGLLRPDWAERAVVNLIDPGSRRRMRFAWMTERPLDRAKQVVAASVSFVLEALLNERRSAWVVVSKSDRDYLKRVHRHASTTAIPVMLPAMPNIQQKTDAGSIVLTIYADLRERHMVSALVKLAGSVLRRVCEMDPRLRIKVMGRIEPDSELLDALGTLPVTFVSWSKDHLGELQRSDIVVLPDAIGTGLKNRAVQCLGLGCAIIGTSVAFEAIEVRNGTEALVADSADQMTDAIITLSRSPALRDAMGRKARDFAMAHYGQDQVMAMWMDLFQSRVAAR